MIKGHGHGGIPANKLRQDMSNGRKQFSRKNSNYTKTFFDAEDTLIYIFILHLFYLSRQIAFDWRIIVYDTVTDRNIAFFLVPILHVIC